LTIRTSIDTPSNAELEKNGINNFPGEYLNLTISDTGVGMSMKTKEKIFEPFFTTKDMGRGSGLGLASVYGIIKNHHGFITVESIPKEGTSFHVFIPLDKTPSVENKSKILKTQKHESASVLLIDDEEYILDINKEILEDEGFTVSTCKDGVEGINYYSEHNTDIDIILLDIIMPKLGGYDCFTQLKKINPECKVIVSSGYSIDGEARKMLDEGACDFLQKPFTREKLFKTIHTVLSQ
jgi:CheY-like chemotaxis protein